MSEQQPSRRAGPKLSQVAIDLWKRVRDAGGWWTASEVIRWSGLDAKVVRGSLSYLARAHYFAQRLDHQTGLLRFGVTGLCDAPKGESLEPGPLPAELGPAWGG